MDFLIEMLCKLETFKNIHWHLHETGTLEQSAKPERWLTVRTIQLKHNVLNLIEEILLVLVSGVRTTGDKNCSVVYARWWTITFNFDCSWFLTAKYGDCWIGESGPHSWPIQSTDLSLLDYFLLKYLKSLVYVTPVDNLDDLRN